MNGQLKSYTLEHLSRFSTLAKVLDEDWLLKQLAKETRQWSLIMGWLAIQEDDLRFPAFEGRLLALDHSLAFLQQHVDRNIWSKLKKKVRAHTNRANTKGTLAEIALAVFLAQRKLPFEMEKQLDPDSNRDVDFTIRDPNGCILNVEIHRLGLSDSDIRLGERSADYGGIPFNISFNAMAERVQNRMLSKAEKFTRQAITLLAFDITDDGLNRTTIPDAFREALEERNAERYSIIDGVVWFEMKPGELLVPQGRDICTNPYSSFESQILDSKFYEYWKSKKT